MNKLSIKRLTLLGFTLVALPLMLMLFFSAQQVTTISSQGTTAIFKVANLEQTNRQLNKALISAERFASQFIVLQEPELKNEFIRQQQKINELITLEPLAKTDRQLSQLTEQLVLKLSSIAFDIEHKQFELTLTELQTSFQGLTEISELFRERSNQIIFDNANSIKMLEQASSTLMLKSLVIIPISIILAGFFIYLITQPLKVLLKQVKLLAQGKFDQKISVTSSPEIKEIADALEVMRNRIHALELQKSSFIRHISHELKTPLAAIREGTSLIDDNSVGPLNSEQQEICGIIKHSVTRLQKIIEDLLDFNIVLDSTSLQDSEKLTLATIIDKVLEDRKLDIKKKQLVINQAIPAIALYSNAKQLTVVVDNLLSNAIKYSPEKGVIDITAGQQQGEVSLQVTDQGPGIAKEHLNKVFDAFYQGTPPSDASVKGSGLGLTIVKELVMRLNGDIKIASQAHPAKDKGKGTGTRVSIHLPRAISSNK